MTVSVHQCLCQTLSLEATRVDQGVGKDVEGEGDSVRPTTWQADMVRVVVELHLRGARMQRAECRRMHFLDSVFSPGDGGRDGRGTRGLEDGRGLEGLEGLEDSGEASGSFHGISSAWLDGN